MSDLLRGPLSNVQRLARARPHTVDFGFALLFSAVSFLSSQESADRYDPAKVFSALHILVAAGAGLPFAFRRLAPLSSLAAAFGLVFATIALESPDATIQIVVCWFVVHAVAAYAEPRAMRWAEPFMVAVTVGLFVALTVLVFKDRAPAVAGSWGRFRSLITTYIAVSGVLGTSWFGGLASRARQAHVALLFQRSVDLEQSQEQQARQAVSDERVRISREVHDVVAHHVSVMGVQAGAARLMLRRDPERANDILSGIERSSRMAIADLGRVVALLRTTDGQPETPAPDDDQQANQQDIAPPARRITAVDEPQPGVEQLTELVAEARTAGMEIAFSISGSAVEVPSSVGLGLYRIAQEALTNVRKHAATDAPTIVELQYRAENVELRVENRGRIAQSVRDLRGSADHVTTGDDSRKVGHGLLGMRERVALVGGAFIAGPVPGGYRVTAVLPLLPVFHAVARHNGTAP